MLLQTSAVLLATLLPISARNLPALHPPPQVINKRGLTTRSPEPLQAASPLTVSSHVLTLTTKKPASGIGHSAAALLKSHDSTIPVGHSTGLISLFLSEEFATEVSFGDETFELIVDTGSSDTWVVEKGFQCINITTSAPLTEADCYFGPPYSVTKEFKQIPDENFNITYGDGEFLSGILGYEKVTVAGLTVNQTVALVNTAAWEGDSTTSGLIGLAYPAL